MARIDDGGPAYPMAGECATYDGFSKLEAYALAAMQAIIHKDKWRNPFTSADMAGIASESFEFASAMLAEHNRRVKVEK